MTEKIPTQNFVGEYRVLYHAFHQLNRLCWQNRLPLCRIEIYSHRGGRVLACAVNGKPYLIRFNLPYLAHGDDGGFIAVMAHEMTHIWQYEKGGRADTGRILKTRCSGSASSTSSSAVHAGSVRIQPSATVSTYADSCSRTVPPRSG